ncbi:MAG: DUF3616 domain-containing protein [Acidobacteria bacterium]|nr:DUF3616 domain-containing protein [Acidobacteriota bacterium]
MKRSPEEKYVLLVGGAAVLALALVTGALWILKSGQPQGNNPALPSDTPANVNGKAKQDKKDKKPVSDAKQWTNGEGRESSGAAWVPGTNQVLFVDDKDSQNILCVTLDDDANQSGDLIPVPLGTKVDDAEDITFDGTYYYVQGSQFRRKSDKGDGIVRFKYDPQSHAVSDLQGIEDWKGLLQKNVPELATSQGQVRTEDAINIEGLGWDPNGKRLLLGFRNPVMDGMAIVVPVSFKDPSAAFTADNVSFAPAIKLNLGGLAIRSIEWDAAKGKFLIIAGAMEGEKKEGFVLYSWDGSSEPAKVLDLDKKIKPEGITPIDRDSGHFLYIVGDAGYYQKLEDPLP